MKKDLQLPKEEAWVIIISGSKGKLEKLKDAIIEGPVSVFSEGENMKIKSTDEKTLEYITLEIEKGSLEEVSFKLVEVTPSWEKVFCGRV